MEMIQVKLLTETATLPTKAHLCDAGWDLYADYTDTNLEILPGERKLVSTGISMQIPLGYYGRIADRSGNAYRSGVHVLAGVIDHGYCGEIKVLLINLSKETFVVNSKDRVAQLVIEAINMSSLLVVDELDETERGANGFGSSGK